MFYNVEGTDDVERHVSEFGRANITFGNGDSATFTGSLSSQVKEFETVSVPVLPESFKEKPTGAAHIENRSTCGKGLAQQLSSHAKILAVSRVLLR
jgi:hypothetical protein